MADPTYIKYKFLFVQCEIEVCSNKNNYLRTYIHQQETQCFLQLPQQPQIHHINCVAYKAYAFKNSWDI